MISSRPFLLLLISIGVTVAEEIMPRARAIVNIPKMHKSMEVRRSPVHHVDTSAFVPHAHTLQRASSGVVRRAPESNIRRAVPSRPAPRQPLSAHMMPMMPFQMIPIPILSPVPIPVPQVQPQPQIQIPTVEVTHPPMQTVSFPTLATISMPQMPTLPTFTMPPSFQRLLGITEKPKTKDYGQMKHGKPLELDGENLEEDSRRYRARPPPSRESEREREHEREPEPVRELPPVRSRLPKYVSESGESVKPEQDADWIVPF